MFRWRLWARLRHALRIMAGEYPLPSELEGMEMSSIHARLDALEANYAELKGHIDTANQSAETIASLEKQVGDLASQVSGIAADIGSEPTAEQAAPASDQAAATDTTQTIDGASTAVDASTQVL